jgi:hypothetical protein
MVRAAAIGFAALVLLGGWARPARGDNPRVSLKVENATLEDAASALAQAAGVTLEVNLPKFPPGAALPPGAPSTEKVTFDWTNSSLARAMRQLCEKFNLRPARRPGGYQLHPTFQPPGVEPKRVGLVEKSGVRLFARSINVYDSRGVNFVDANNAWGGNARVNLTLGAEMGDGDGEAVAGIENVTARDDQGNFLVNDQQQAFHYVDNAAPFPDEWHGSVNLPGPHPKAKKLAWVEGDFVVFRSVRPVRVEIPLPLKEKSVRAQAGELIIAASRYRVIPKAEPENDEADLPGPRFGAQPAASGPIVRVRVFVPIGTRYSSRAGGWGMPPFAVGASGKSYPAQTFHGGSSGSDGQWTVFDTTWMFPGMEEEPVKLVWDLVEKTRPEKLFSFRMADVPLPAPELFVARLQPAPRPSVPAPSRPFYEQGGGTLVSRIEVAGKPASEGTLQIGLAAADGAGFGPVRWTETAVSPAGSALLEDVKPGRYRLLRVYRSRTPLPEPEEGRWVNGEAVIEILAGKETSPAVLRWVTQPAPPAARPAARPPAARPTARPPAKPPARRPGRM